MLACEDCGQADLFHAMPRCRNCEWDADPRCTPDRAAFLLRGRLPLLWRDVVEDARVRLPLT